jgi:hypothetical protein
MELLITEITNMSGGMRCVAGWCPAEGRMVRPLPNGHNWSQQLINEVGLEVGSKISVIPIGAHNGSLPHTTEDLRVQGSQIRVIEKGFNGWIGASGPAVAKDLSSAFDGFLLFGAPFRNVQKGLHVTTGDNCKSLVGLNLPAKQLMFRENQFQEEPPKLHAILTFGPQYSPAKYEVTVASTKLNAIWRDQGINALNQHLPKDGFVHVRVGLARGWGARPDYCTVMLNGVLW